MRPNLLVVAFWSALPVILMIACGSSGDADSGPGATNDLDGATADPNRLPDGGTIDPGPFPGIDAGRPAPRVITVKKGEFFDGDKPWRPIGVNYAYPHYSQPFYNHTTWDWVTLWDAPEWPDIHAKEDIEADFALMEAKKINEFRLFAPQAIVGGQKDPSTFPSPERSYCARLNTLLDLAGNHGIHVTMILPLVREGSGGNYGFAASQEKAEKLMSYTTKLIDACGLAYRSEIFSFTIDGEGEVESPTARKFVTRGNAEAVGLWNAWLTDRYGSPQKAEARWGETLRKECIDVERDGAGKAVVNGCPDLDVWDAGCKAHGPRVCPPRLAQVTDADGEPEARWGDDSNAKRAFVRFTDWVMNKRTQRIREILRRHDPWHLLGTDSILQDGYCSKSIFLRREQTKYTDYSGVHIYHHQYTGGHWDAPTFGEGEKFDKLLGTAAALAWMNPERRPIIVGEVGVSVLGNCATTTGFCIEGTEADRHAVQKALVPFEAAIEAAGGARGYRWWWWRGQRPMGGYPDETKPRDGEVSDYGVLTPAGKPRPILDAFGPTIATLDAVDAVPTSETITYQFDPSPSCSPFILDDAGRLTAISAVLQKKPFRARTQCSGKDTSNAPATGIDGAGYFAGCDAGDAEHCTPLVCVDAMFEKIEVLDVNGAWADARDGKKVVVKKGQPVKVRTSVGNVGESAWAATAATGEARIALGGTGLALARVKIPASVPSFDSTTAIEFTAIASASVATTFRMRMVAEGRMFFGESVTVALDVAE